MDPLTRKIVNQIGKERIKLESRIETGLNTLWRVTFEGQDAVLKIHTEKAGDESFFHNYEGNIMKRISGETDLKIPEVLLISEQDNPSYMITEFVEGIHGDEVRDTLEFGDQKELMYELGDQLSELHENVSFYRFAYLRKNGKEINAWRTFDSWKHLFLEHVELDLSDLENTRFERYQGKIRGLIDSNIDELDREFEPVAIHDDNRHDNLIWDRELKAVIDWATGFNGTAGFDIVKAEFLMIDYDLMRLEKNRKNELRDELYSGYGTDFRNKNDLWTLYTVSNILWTMKGFSNWAENYRKKYRREIGKNLGNKLERLGD